MPDYKRLVSYMYTYEEGKKRNNVGYARVEARNGQCKFTIHVSALSYNERQVTVYAFKRNKNEIEGIELGKLNFRNEVGDFRLVTDPSRILNSKYGIDDIGGIVLYHTRTKYLATVWDENPLTMDMVASLEFKETNIFKADANVVLELEKEVESIVEKEIDIEKVAENIVEKAIEKVVEKEVEKVVENIVEKEVENEDSFDKVTATAKEETIVPKSEEIKNDNIEESLPEQEERFAESEEKTDLSKDEIVHDLSRREKGCGCNNTRNRVEDIMNRNSSNNGYGNFSTFGSEESPLASKMYKNFPRMHPFEDNEVDWCVRIEPKDIGVLPVDVWPLANNSFLLHGFYGHRHLIFAKVNNRNSNSYIIGVPGIYHNRERFMAKMFGFENFKCAKKRDRREGEFGYWYVPVRVK